jgi:hypothetical protein
MLQPQVSENSGKSMRVIFILRTASILKTLASAFSYEWCVLRAPS